MERVIFIPIHLSWAHFYEPDVLSLALIDIALVNVLG